ncbi:Cas8a1 family CRISPR/Cas system-associated protein [Bradyrhizobium sp. Pha-3]|uniref:Cas8a1 family CRISPR/Cas system-associated protein n=1 Tax=Bradyrhizobium sp. Pha-3 TaxID=208375 RepID=UPI0035D4474A
MLSCIGDVRSVAVVANAGCCSVCELRQVRLTQTDHRMLGRYGFPFIASTLATLINSFVLGF